MRIYTAIHTEDNSSFAATNLNSLGKALKTTGNALRVKKSRIGMPFKSGLHMVYESELLKGKQLGNASNLH